MVARTAMHVCLQNMSSFALKRAIPLLPYFYGSGSWVLNTLFRKSPFRIFPAFTHNGEVA
jgi:hypothetical protein